MMQKLTIFSLCVFAIFGYSVATSGVDVSTAVSQQSWRCIKNANNNFAIVRVYQSNGQLDPNGAQTIKNARASGIDNVDAYIFPCRKCDPKRQISDTVNHLKQTNAKIGQLWIDVEAPQLWGTNHNGNVQFIQDMINQADLLKVKVAIYTSQSQWQPITGNSNKFGDLPLWYAHYDNQPNFNDFKPFGAWKKPAIKQYVGTTNVCGVSVDKNWYP